MLDDLHNLDLGVAARLCGVGLTSALQDGLFGNERSELGFKLGLRTINLMLKDYYKGKRDIAKHGPLKLTSLGYKNLATRGHLHGKGSEIKHMVPFVTRHVLKDSRRRHLVRALTCLTEAYDLMKEPVVDSSKLHKLLVQVGMSSAKAKVKLIPKFHYLGHFGRQSARSGNPTACSTKPDESKNSDTVRVAQMCHTRDFSARLLSREVVQLRLLRDLPLQDLRA
jgi:hypothetical protein